MRQLNETELLAVSGGTLPPLPPIRIPIREPEPPEDWPREVEEPCVPPPEPREPEGPPSPPPDPPDDEEDD